MNIYIYLWWHNISYVSHYLNNICYLQDNYRLDIAAILKYIGGFNISSHTSQYMTPVSSLSLLPMNAAISLIAFHSQHFISNPGLVAIVYIEDIRWKLFNRVGSWSFTYGWIVLQDISLFVEDLWLIYTMHSMYDIFFLCQYSFIKHDAPKI